MKPIFTRDSWLWTILFTFGLAIAAGLAFANPADYGLTPVQMKWLQLFGTGLTAVGGKLGNSPQPHSAYGRARMTPEDDKR